MLARHAHPAARAARPAHADRAAHAAHARAGRARHAHAAHTRAGSAGTHRHRGRARPAHAHRLRELRQKAEREVPLLPRLQLPAREARPEAPLPRRRHPLLDVVKRVNCASERMSENAQGVGEVRAYIGDVCARYKIVCTVVGVSRAAASRGAPRARVRDRDLDGFPCRCSILVQRIMTAAHSIAIGPAGLSGAAASRISASMAMAQIARTCRMNCWNGSVSSGRGVCSGSIKLSAAARGAAVGATVAGAVLLEAYALRCVEGSACVRGLFGRGIRARAERERAGYR